MASNAKRIFLPSIASIIFLGIFALVFIKINMLLSDGDTGFHIRTGEYILQHKVIPSHDVFSFHQPPLLWVNHEWLSDILIGFVHLQGGLTAVVIMFALCIALIHYLLFNHIRRECNLLIAVLLTMLAATSTLFYWLARPHVLSILLLVIWSQTLYDFQYRGKKNLKVFIPLMLLWVNMHGSFIIGLALLGVYILGNAVNLVLRYADRAESLQLIKTLSLYLLGCFLVTGLNPYGYKIYYFLHTFMNEGYIFNFVMEFASPDFHEGPFFQYFLYILLIASALSRKSLDIIEVLLVVLLLSMSLYSMRHIFLFVVTLLPVVAKYAQALWNRLNFAFFGAINEGLNRLSQIDARCRSVFVFIALFCFISYKAFAGEMNYQLTPECAPVEALKYLKSHPIKGNVFNHDEFGDYIIYASPNDPKVFFDGRNHIYGKAFKAYTQVIGLSKNWKHILNKYDIQWIFFPTETVFSASLKDSSEWDLVYSDKIASIFVRKPKK